MPKDITRGSAVQELILYWDTSSSDFLEMLFNKVIIIFQGQCYYAGIVCMF